jgi:hypothetical protein
MAGEKLLSVTDPERRLVPRREALHVRVDQQQAGLELVLLEGITMRSRVVDQAGAPIEGASIQVRPPETGVFDQGSRVESDHDGRFELTGLAPGESRLAISKSGYNGVYEAVDPAAPKSEYVLMTAPRVHGRVLDALRDEPITDFTVIIAVDGSTWSNQSTWQDGEFGVDVNEDEPATVSIQAPGYQELTFEQVLPSDTALRPLEFRMHREP